MIYTAVPYPLTVTTASVELELVFASTRKAQIMLWDGNSCIMSSSDNQTAPLLAKVRTTGFEMMLSMYSMRTRTVTVSLLLKLPSTVILGLNEEIVSGRT